MALLIFCAYHWILFKLLLCWTFQEPAYIKIHAEVPELLSSFAKPVNTKVYATWQKFIDAFLSQGEMVNHILQRRIGVGAHMVRIPE
jgi:hypothetical protein